jgi:hydrophobic/amphiphilic exporter-1 (mainly G- bacteria), HAE1 family
MIRYFTSHPTAANLLMLMLIIIGLLVSPTLKRETFPDFAAQEVEVRVVYPAASAEDVEEAICQRIEDAADGITDVEEIRCEAREGLGLAVIKLVEGGDMSRFLDDVKTEVEAIDNFPEQSELPIIQQLGRTDQVVSVAITGPMSVSHLKAYAEEIKDRLQFLDHISQVDIEGFSDHQLRIEIPALILRQYGLSMPDIADKISRQNINISAGGIETKQRDILVRFDDERKTPQELEGLIILSGDTGAEIRLGDIATITDQFELDEDKILFNGKRAALLKITKTKQQDTLDVVNAVKSFVDEEQLRAPANVNFILTQDMASIVQDRLQMLLTNGWQGLILVFLTLWLFFKLRFSFWVVMGLPVSFLGGLAMMALLGYSINMITMVALLIALGLLMDDALVIAENIATHLHKGKTALQAAIDGTKQVAPGVMSSFLTTVAVFGPLAFIEGDIGKVLKVLPVALILVMAVSLIEAFFILPHHLAHALHHHENDKSNEFREKFDRLIEHLRHEYLGKAIDTVIYWRYLFLGLVVGIFLLSIGMIASGILKFQAFPDIEGDVIEARILLPQGTPLWQTEAIVEKISQALNRVNDKYTQKQVEQNSLVVNTSVNFNKNIDASESGPHVATLVVDLLTAETRVGTIDNIINDWRTEVGEIPDVLSINYKEPAIGPAGLPIDMRLSGADLNTLKAASLELQNWLARYKGVQDLSDDLRPGKPEIRLQLREGVLALGLDASNIANQLRAGFYGSTTSEIQVGQESYEIDVRLTDLDQDNLSDLEDFRIITPDGSLVPLSIVTDIISTRGYARINRIDGRQTVTIQGDVDTQYANAMAIVGDTQAKFFPELLLRYPTIDISIEGEADSGATTAASIRRGFLIGLMGVFVLLSFQFRSYIEPLIVMVAIPLALIGVVWGHLLMGYNLSMPSMMGFVSLSGIVVNDSILLVEFLKLRAREGHDVVDAAKMASRERFRAILLTSVTTIAGLIPLLFEKSTQAQVLIPLITSIVFGLLVTTILVLLVVPALFSVLDDFGLTSVSNSNDEKVVAETG